VGWAKELPAHTHTHTHKQKQKTKTKKKNHQKGRKPDTTQTWHPKRTQRGHSATNASTMAQTTNKQQQQQQMAVTYTGVKTQASPQSPQPHKETPKPKQNKKKNKKMPKTKHKQTNKQTNKQDKRGDGSMDTLAFPVIVRMVCAGLHAHELRNKENKPTEETSKAVRQSKRLWGGVSQKEHASPCSSALPALRFALCFCVGSNAA